MICKMVRCRFSILPIRRSIRQTTSRRVSSFSTRRPLEPIGCALKTTVALRILALDVDQREMSLFFRYKFGIEAKDYSHLAQFQNLEDVEVQTQWIVDSLYEVQDTVE